jgi:hypothetical protein
MENVGVEAESHQLHLDVQRERVALGPVELGDHERAGLAHQYDPLSEEEEQELLS